MAVQTRILPEFELLVFAHNGRVTMADIAAAWRTIEADPNYRHDFDEIALLGPDFDHSELDFDMTRSEAQRYVSSHKAARARQKRTAFVCANDLQRAVARLFAAYVESHEPYDIQVRALPELNQALDWLESSKAPGSSFDRTKLMAVACELGHAWCIGRVAGRRDMSA